MVLYFEDISVGRTRELGTYTAEREELLAFAERYDPQPIHTDPAAAAETLYGGVIASGWHTASACMRLVVDGFLGETATLGAFGVDELRWSTPVRPGDTVTVVGHVTDKRASESRDDRGYVKNEVVATNEADEEVLFWRATNIFRRRPAGAADTD